MKLTWKDINEIGFQLAEKFPDKAPLGVRFTDLLEWVLELEDFEGRREESNEAKLEAIQMAWLEEWQSNQD